MLKKSLLSNPGASRFALIGLSSETEPGRSGLAEAWQGSSEKGPFLPLAAGPELEQAEGSGLLSAPS